MTAFLLLAGLFLALGNGANDNFKGLATVWGAGALSYRTALAVATVATLAGGIASIFIAEALARTFSGNGLVPDAAVAAPAFLPAVAAGAGFTVMVATRTGMPVSTTHALIGGLVGAGLAVAGTDIDLHQLGGKFFLPLLASPVISALLGLAAYRLFRLARARRGDPDCLCIVRPAAAVATAAETALESPAGARLVVASGRECDEAPAPLARFPMARITDLAHLASAASICFARGVNDAPKIAALLLGARLAGMQASIALVTVAMAIGGILFARRVAETMSLRLNRIDPVQGLAANFITAGLVLTASGSGLPVSTTHVSVGSIAGAGVGAGTLRPAVLEDILLSWVATLPAAALAAWIFAVMLA